MIEMTKRHRGVSNAGKIYLEPIFKQDDHDSLLKRLNHFAGGVLSGACLGMDKMENARIRRS